MQSVHTTFMNQRVEADEDERDGDDSVQVWLWRKDVGKSLEMDTLGAASGNNRIVIQSIHRLGRAIQTDHEGNREHSRVHASVAMVSKKGFRV